MLSQRQFTDAISFMRSYKDALNCTEQIAERRAAYSHYESLATTMVDALKNKQLKIDGNSVSAGPNFQNFPMLKSHSFANGLIKQYGLGSIGTRQEFDTKLDKAIKELQNKAK